LEAHALKITQHTFPGTIKLYNLGDVHRGDRACNDKLFRKIIGMIAQAPNGYWVSTGDLLNVALKASKSDVYGSMSLEEEKDVLRSELAPIAKKCLGVVKSNHHNRFDREVGMSLDRLLCELIGLPFLGGLGIMNLTCGRTSYFVAMHHGAGGGGMRGGKANSLQRLAVIVPGADLYLEGHTHTYQSFMDTAHYIDRKRNLMSEGVAHFCTTGHFLEWSGSYAVDLKLPAMPQGAAMIELTGNGLGKITNKKVKMDLVY
jgi:hypothetical protein